MPEIRVFLSLLVAAAALSACPQAPVEVQIVHRCGDLNFTDLSGAYGRLQGENNVNSRYRAKFTTENGKILGKFVFGGHGGSALVGEPAGHEKMLFREAGTGKRRQARASISDDCRLEVVPGWIDGGTETDDPGEVIRLVPLAELKGMDFEPCTETLFAFAGARDRKAAKPPAEGKIPVTRRSSMPIGAWSKKTDVPAGCTPVFDLYVDGEADAFNVATIEEKGEWLNWGMDRDNSFLGLHSYSMHRFAKCGGERELLGVACMQMEIK